METSLRYELAQKQLGFKLREKVTTKLGFELKFNGIFNTATNELQHRAALKKQFHIGNAPSDGASTPLLLGLGVVHMSGFRPQEPKLTVSAKKKVAVLTGPNTLISTKLWSDIDYNGKNLTRNAIIKFSHKALNFTRRQDIKLSVGGDVAWPKGQKRPAVSLYLQARENNWAITMRNNQVALTYDL